MIILTSIAADDDDEDFDDLQCPLLAVNPLLRSEFESTQMGGMYVLTLYSENPGLRAHVSGPVPQQTI